MVDPHETELGDRIEDAEFIGRLVALRPLAPADYDWAYAVHCRPSTLLTYRFRGIPLAAERFPSLLWDGVACQFVVVDVRAPQKRLGIVLFYDRDDHSQTASLAVVRDVAAAGGAAFWEGVGLAVNHYFRVTNCRKIRVEIAGWNTQQLRALSRLGLSKEGILAEQDFMDGRFWDRHLWALFRSDWLRVRSDLLPEVAEGRRRLE